jgi:hypothetical protein
MKKHGVSITPKEKKPTNPNCTNAGNIHTCIHTYIHTDLMIDESQICWFGVCLLIAYVLLFPSYTVRTPSCNKKSSSRCPIVFLKQFYILTNGAYNAHGFLTICWETIFYVPDTYATRGLIGALDWNKKLWLFSLICSFKRIEEMQV